MKGLLIKDILNLKNYSKQLIIVFIFFAAYGIFMKNGTFIGAMFTMMLSMQVITTMSYDEYAKWDKFALTMNVNRKDIVLSKYVFFIICVLVGFVFSMVMSFGINYLADESMTALELLVTSLMIISVFVILFSIIIPIMFKNGVEKARIVMMAVFFIPLVLIFAIFKIVQQANIPMPNENTLITLTKILPVVMIVLAVIACFISYKISVKIYSKKEF